MTQYIVNKLDEIEGKQDIFKLFKNGVCQFDEFEKEIEQKGQYEEELNSIYSLIEDIANNQLLPKTKFRDITNGKDPIKEYEFKSKHLRVYAIKGLHGKIIILGGYKNRQKKDIRQLRSIKTDFLKTETK